MDSGIEIVRNTASPSARLSAGREQLMAFAVASVTRPSPRNMVRCLMAEPFTRCLITRHRPASCALGAQKADRQSSAMGWSPSAFWYMTMKAVVDSYHKSPATRWTVAPPASSRSAMTRCS